MRSKRNVIGNLALPKEKYLTIKSHLLAQIRDILKQKKRAPSLADIVNECGTPEKNTLVQLANFAKPSEQSGLNPEIEKAFSETASLIFGKPLSGSVCDYSEWLKRHIINVAETESVLGSGKTTVPNYENYHAFDKSRNRFVNLSEASQLSEIQKLGEIEAEKLDFSNVSGLLSGVAFLSAQFHDGVFSNVTNCPIIINSANCYSILGCVNVKDSAFCTWPNGSDHVFGCAFTFNSSFNVNCYSSFNLTRCFEVDSSSNCSDSYFCHNCENVHDSMFCFNSKNLRYAIGNVVVGREQYQRAKSMLQSWLREGFETDKAVDSDIFNIGSA